MRTIAIVSLLLASCGADLARVTVAITADGTVSVGGEPVTLDELAALFAARRDTVPSEDHPYGGKVSALRVVLDIEDDVPWSHVISVIQVAAEQRLVRLIFPGGHSVTLPKDLHVHDLSEPDHLALLVRILILEDGRYVIDERTTADIREIGAWVEAAPKAFIDARVGMIRAQARAPWRRLRPVFDLLRDLGVTWIDFYGSSLPSPEERQRPSLPPPPSQPRPRGWPGLVDVPYWPEFRYYEDDEVSPPRAGLRAMLEEHCLTVGRAAFESDDALGNAACGHAEEMRRLGYFGHFSPTPADRSPSDRLARSGWPAERHHAELLAKAETAEAAFTAILAKPENVKILADPAFKYAGVAQCGDCWVVLLGAEK